MIAREVIVSPRARADLLALSDRIAEAASPDVASGLRIVGFERRLSIAFVVQPRHVVILRILYGGRDWTSGLDERGERS